MEHSNKNLFIMDEKRKEKIERGGEAKFYRIKNALLAEGVVVKIYFISNPCLAEALRELEEVPECPPPTLRL